MVYRERRSFGWKSQGICIGFLIDNSHMDKKEIYNQYTYINCGFLSISFNKKISRWFKVLNRQDDDQRRHAMPSRLPRKTHLCCDVCPLLLVHFVRSQNLVEKGCYQTLLFTPIFIYYHYCHQFRIQVFVLVTYLFPDVHAAWLDLKFLYIYILYLLVTVSGAEERQRHVYLESWTYH